MERINEPVSPFGRLIRRHRTTRLWSEKELARRSGVPQATLSRYETSEIQRLHQPTRTKVAAIAAAFGDEQVQRDMLLAAGIPPDGSGIVALIDRLGQTVPNLSGSGLARVELTLDVLVGWAESAQGESE